uniref:Novel immune-type receptor 9 n=1 Tax=Scleropages formosus TaxID=113540 RepID=A0A8C9S7Y1_SCLFO
MRLCLALVLFFTVFKCKVQIEDTVQPIPLMVAQVGDTVTLECFFPRSATSYVLWYKQSMGQKPRLVSMFYKYANSATFFNEFQRNPRYSANVSMGINHLIISDTQVSDSGTYYCGKLHVNTMTFGDGTLLITGTKMKSRTVVQQPVSDPVRPGDSVTLQCTVDSETCAGEHSVYWFRHGSGESLPGLIYTHGNRSDECEKSPEAGSPTHGCVYSLPKRNLSRSDAGIYYCAVATCGDILFGNGTVVNMFLLHAVYCLGATLALCVILIVILICLINKRTHCQHCRGMCLL